MITILDISYFGIKSDFDTFEKITFVLNKL